MSEFTNGTVAQRRISRVAEMLFGGDESLIPVLDYSSSYLSRPIILPPPMFSHPAVIGNEGRRGLQWWDATGYVLNKDPP